MEAGVTLRERKKIRQRVAILAAAVDLAEPRGFDGLRVRELIERLEISEATFFNYYPSKARLLDAWLEDQFANAFSDLNPPERAAAPRSLRTVLRDRVRQLAEQAGAATGLGAAAWTQGRVGAAALAAASRCDLEAALARLHQEDRLRRDVSPRELAELVLSAVAVALSAGRSASDRGDAPPSVEPMGARAIRALDVVLDGANKRHERVRLGARGEPVRPRPA